MPTSQQLTGSQQPVQIAPGYSLQAPDLRGTITQMTPSERVTRSDTGLYEDRLQAALQDAGIRTPQIFELAVTQDGARTPSGTTRSGASSTRTRDDEPAIVLRAPSLGPNVDQAVLYTDEAGVSRWIFPQPGSSGATRTTRGGGDPVVFHLPRASAPTPPAETDKGATRGPISKLGRRLVRVLTWLTDDIIGQGALAVATRWETANRDYGFHMLPLSPTGAPIAWDALRRGRALLFLHGTFSSTAGAFSSLPSATIDQLSQMYGGRIFGFDHPSMHRSPQENAQRFLDLLPDGIELDLDIVTHSRGGLVGRELTEHAATLQQGGRNLRIGKAVLVAAPNCGTVLADGDHGIVMLDRYTNLLTSLPDNAYTLTMEGVLMLAKLLLHGALKALPGLSAMHPKGSYLARLNAGPLCQTSYYALTANFTPSAPGLMERFGRTVANKLIDGIFGEDNDGVVPTRGSYECAPGAPGFPIPAERRIVFEGAEQTHHCNYFANQRVSKQIVEWLAE